MSVMASAVHVRWYAQYSEVLAMSKWKLKLVVFYVAKSLSLAVILMS